MHEDPLSPIGRHCGVAISAGARRPAVRGNRPDRRRTSREPASRLRLAGL